MWRDSANVAKCFSPVLGGSAGGDKTWISSGQLAAVLSRPLPWWVLHGRDYVHIRIGLLPVVVPGDCLVSAPTLCLSH